MTDQSGLSHTAGSYQCHIASIVERIKNGFGLLLSVAEEFRTVISRNEERVIGLHTISIILLRVCRNANIAIKYKVTK